MLWGKKEKATLDLLYFLMDILTPEQEELMHRWIKQQGDV
jgi:hypothetical protein